MCTECELLKDRIRELEKSAEIANEYIVKALELDSVKHRIILCALAGDMEPAKLYMKIEDKYRIESAHK